MLDKVSPACAGMIPGSTDDIKGNDGEPRMRGDDPEDYDKVAVYSV